VPDRPSHNQYRPDPLDEAPAEIQQKVAELRARLADRETKLAGMRKIIREAGVKLNMYKAGAKGALNSPEAKKQIAKAVAILREREERVQHVKKVYRRLLHSKEQAERDFTEEVETYKDTITRLRAQIDVQVDTQQALQQQETQAEAERDQLLAENTGRIGQLEAQIAEYAQTIGARDSEIEEHKVSETRWRDREQQLVQELEQRRAERDDLQQQVESRREEQTGRSAEQDKLIEERDQTIAQQAVSLRELQEAESQLKERIAGLEADHQTGIETLTSQLKQIQNQLKEQTAAVKDRDKQITQAVSAKERFEKQEQQLKQELEELRADREKLQKQVESLQKPKRGRPSAQAKLLKEREKTIEQQAEALKELEPLRVERDDLQKQLETLQKKKKGRADEKDKLLKEREKTIEQQTQTLRKLEQAKAELTERISQRASEHQTELDDLSDRLQQAQDERKEQSDAVEQRDQAIEQQAQTLKGLEQSEADLTERISQLENNHQIELSELSEQFQQVQDELKEQTAAVEQRDTQIDEQKNAEIQLCRKEEQLQQELDQIRSDNTDLQQQLQNHQAEYERAIVEQTQLLQARDRLLEQRDTMITEKAAALRKLEQSAAPLRKKIEQLEIDHQAEIVKLTEQLQDSETRLEARLTVIKERDRELAEARRTWEQSEEKLQKKIAYLEATHGAETDRLTGRLEQAQADLEQQIAAVEQRDQTIEQHLSTQKKLEDQATELDAQIHSLTDVYNDKTATLNGQIKQAEARLEEQCDALAKRDERIRELSAAEKDLRQSREAIEAQIAQLAQEHRTELKNLKQQLAEKDDTLTHQRNEIAGRDQRIAERDAERSELHKAREQLSAQLADLQREHQIILEALQDKTAQLNATEHRLYEERSNLQSELDNKTSASDKSIGQLQQQLEALREKDREFDQQAGQIAEERDNAVAALTEARQQLQEHRKEMQIVKSRLTSDQRDRVDLLRQIDQLNQALTDAKRAASAKAPIPVGIEKKHAVVASQPTGRPRLLATAAAISLLLTSVGLTTSMLTRQQSATYDAVGWIKVTDGDRSAVRTCAGEIEKLRQDLGDDEVATRIDEPNRMIEMRIDQPSDPDAARVQLDKFGELIVAQFEPKAGRVTAADRAAIESAVVDELAGIKRGFASLMSKQENSPNDNRHARLVSWNQALNRRQNLADSITQLSKADSHELPSEHAVPVDPDHRKEAELADAALQADIAETEQRETRLTEMLVQTLDNGEAHFLALSQATTEGGVYLKEVLAKGYGEEIDQRIKTLQESLVDWAAAANMLSEAWSAAQKDLASDADPLSVRDILAPAVRAFALTTQISFEQFRLALESIDQGGDQPTTRVVLRKNLTLRLDPVVEARNEVVFAGRSMLLEDNLELNAAVQSVAGLRVRVDERRERIAQSLRQEAMDKIAAQHRERQADTELRRQELSGQLAEADQHITQLAKQMQAALQQDDSIPSNQTDQITALSERFNGTVEKLAALQESRRQARGDQLKLAYFPAKIEYASSTAGDSWPHALTIGAIPLAACAALLLLMWALNARNRSDASVDEIADTLAETPVATRTPGAGKRAATPAPYLPAGKKPARSSPPTRRKV